MSQFSRSHLYKKPFLYDGVIIAILYDIIIDPDDGKTIGFVINPEKTRFIDYGHMLYMSDGFYCARQDLILDVKDVVHINHIIQNNLLLYNKVVEDRAGNQIGYVYDFTIDFAADRLASFAVCKYKWGFLKFGQKRIITEDKIYAIEPEKIIVLNAYEEVTATSYA